MLNWRTYGALPVLKSYQQALEYFEKVVPIRGDENKTKPVGRRDQKFFSIWKRDTDNAVCVGYAWHSREDGRALLAYHPDGRVAIEKPISVTCRERIQRIAGLNINRHYNEDWVTAAAYVDGEEVIGHYPMQLYHGGTRKATFILRENATALYVNPVPAYKHIINRNAKAEITARYKPFMEYVSAMSKLSADEPSDNPLVPTVSLQEARDMGIHGNSLAHRYGNIDEGQAQFLTFVDSGETEGWYKAMLMLGRSGWRVQLNEAQDIFTHVLHRQYRDTVFIKERVAAGKLVQDRYNRYFK